MVRDGKTSRQMRAAPKHSIFVWRNSLTQYPAALARHLGRDDLRVVPFLWLVDERWRGFTAEGFVVDHSVLDGLPTARRRDAVVKGASYFTDKEIYVDLGRGNPTGKMPAPSSPAPSVDVVKAAAREIDPDAFLLGRSHAQKEIARRAAERVAAAGLLKGAEGPEENEDEFQRGVHHLMVMLAEATGVKDWWIQEGCEERDTVIRATMLHVLEKAGMYENEEGTFARFNAEGSGDAKVREDVIEECAANLARWYPGNANTNAFCAALRSMKIHSGVSSDDKAALGLILTEALATPSAPEPKHGNRDHSDISSVVVSDTPIAASSAPADAAAMREACAKYHDDIRADLVRRKAVADHTAWRNPCGGEDRCRVLGQLIEWHRGSAEAIRALPLPQSAARVDRESIVEPRSEEQVVTEKRL